MSAKVLSVWAHRQGYSQIFADEIYRVRITICTNPGEYLCKSARDKNADKNKKAKK